MVRWLSVVALFLALAAPAALAETPPAEPAAPEAPAAEETEASSSESKTELRTVYQDKNPFLIGAHWVQDTWDLNMDLLFGAVFRDELPFAFAVRLRHGALIVREPWFFSVGPTVQVGMEHPIAFGVQGEVMHLAAGLWGQAGFHVDMYGRPGGQLAGGYTWVGAEVQVRQGRKPGQADWSVYGVLRVPLRFFMFIAQDY